MSIDVKQLREAIIAPALQAIGLHSLAAEELLLGTACQESACGTYLRQLGSGPALGIFQMEPRTHDDIFENYLRFQQDLRGKVTRLSLKYANAEEMVWNLLYATAMCRVHYRRVPTRLPEAGDLQAQARYWKQYYNTPLGAGTVEEYVSNWQKYVR